LLAKAGFHVVAVDFARTGLEIAQRRARQAGVQVRWIEADLKIWPIPRSKYAVVVDTFYTNRRRLADLKASVKPGGVFLVETHVRASGGSAKQRRHRFGVRRGELRRWFRDWEILELEEGELTERGSAKAISRIVARRPR
jgi:SAM-dependent methyltransferase